MKLHEHVKFDIKKIVKVTLLQSSILQDHTRCTHLHFNA